MEDKYNGILYLVQTILSKMDEDEMLGTISLYLAWEIATRTLNINEILWAFNMTVQDSVRRLLGVKEWEDNDEHTN